MKVTVKDSTMVKPITARPTTTLWISNVDAMMPAHCHTLFLYFFRSTGATDFFDTTVLKDSLSRALDEFYPIAGRLKKDNDRIQINCNGEGAVFVEAEADGVMDDLGGDFRPEAELRLIPAVDYSQGISTFPMLLVQVTRFKCGGVCLGIANEHHVTDGYSDIHFINSWSEIGRGLHITIPAFFDRRVLAARNPPQPKFTHFEYNLPPPLKTPHDNSEVAAEIIYSVFKITRDQLNAMKANCQYHQGNKVAYSTYEALAGHVWKCVCKARGLPEDQETKLYIPVDGRLRLQPPLPAGYLGNAVFTAAPIALYGELESNPVKFAVDKVHAALKRMNDEYLRSALDYLELKLADLTQARGPSVFKCPNLGIISWAKMPIYNTDFGWGKPVYMTLGTAPSEGKTFVLPSPVNDGSLLYAISLPRQQMRVFEKLLYEI